jgi:quinol monooxygenase YgiN
MDTTTIKQGETPLTLVNVFSVDPSNQDRFVQLLNEATEKTMRRQPGFVSANIHKSLDGTRVVNYAQWKTKGDFESMLRNAEAASTCGQSMRSPRPIRISAS